MFILNPDLVILSSVPFLKHSRRLGAVQSLLGSMGRMNNRLGNLSGSLNSIQEIHGDAPRETDRRPAGPAVDRQTLEFFSTHVSEGTTDKARQESKRSVFYEYPLAIAQGWTKSCPNCSKPNWTPTNKDITHVAHLPSKREGVVEYESNRQTYEDE